MHSACLVQVAAYVDGDEIRIDGQLRRASRPILCVFDTGLTGCVLSKSLVEDLDLAWGGAGSSPRREGSLRLALRTERGRRVVLGSSASSSKLFYVQQIPLGWFVDPARSPHVVALGQCALGRGVLTVDGPQRRATWTA